MRCANCVEIIITAKERQEKEANKHADLLLKQIDEEKKQKEAKERKREKKKEKKKNKKKHATESSVESEKKFDDDDEKENISAITNLVAESRLADVAEMVGDAQLPQPIMTPVTDQSSASTASSVSHVTAPAVTTSEKPPRSTGKKRRTKKDDTQSKAADENVMASGKGSMSGDTSPDVSSELMDPADLALRSLMLISGPVKTPTHDASPPQPPKKPSEATKSRKQRKSHPTREFVNTGLSDLAKTTEQVEPPTPKRTPKKDAVVAPSDALIAPTQPQQQQAGQQQLQQGQPVFTDGNWDVVKTKKPVRKLTLASNLIARVIGRCGCNVNAIRDVTQTHIDIEKPKKGGGDRTITIRGNNDSTTMAYTLMEELINHPEKEIEVIIDQHFPSESKKRREKEKVKDGETEEKKEDAKLVSIQDVIAIVDRNEKVNAERERAKEAEAAKKRERELVLKAKEEEQRKKELAHKEAATSRQSLSTPNTPRNKQERDGEMTRSVGKKEKHTAEYVGNITRDPDLDKELSKHLRNLCLRDREKNRNAVSEPSETPIVIEKSIKFVDPLPEEKPFETWSQPEPMIKEVVEPVIEVRHPGPIGPPRRTATNSEASTLVQPRTSPMQPRSTFINGAGFDTMMNASAPPPPTHNPTVGAPPSNQGAKKQLIFDESQVHGKVQSDAGMAKPSVGDQLPSHGPPGFLTPIGQPPPKLNHPNTGLVSPIGTPRIPPPDVASKPEIKSHPTSIPAPIAPPTSRPINEPNSKPIQRVPPMVQPGLSSDMIDMMPGHSFSQSNSGFPNLVEAVRVFISFFCVINSLRLV